MKRLFGQWSRFERAWLVTFCSIAVGISVYTKDSFFGFVVFISGVFCVVLAAKGSILNYPIGMVNSLGYGWLAYQNGLFGEQWLNWAFFFPMSIIGFVMWRKHVSDAVVAMRRLAVGQTVLGGGLCLLLIVTGGYGLSMIPGQNSPYIDATVTVLSVVATILMALRFREQWTCYIALDVFAVIIWVIRWANGSPSGPLMVVMWTAFLVNAIYGYYTWSRGSRRAVGVCVEAGAP